MKCCKSRELKRGSIKQKLFQTLVVHKLHERISMVPWGVFRLTTSPFFYLPRGKWEWGNGGMGKWGNGEMGKWGNGEFQLKP